MSLSWFDVVVMSSLMSDVFRTVSSVVSISTLVFSDLLNESLEKAVLLKTGGKLPVAVYGYENVSTASLLGVNSGLGGLERVVSPTPYGLEDSRAMLGLGFHKPLRGPGLAMCVS